MAGCQFDESALYSMYFKVSSAVVEHQVVGCGDGEAFNLWRSLFSSLRHSVWNALLDYLRDRFAPLTLLNAI